MVVSVVLVVAPHARVEVLVVPAVRVEEGVAEGEAVQTEIAQRPVGQRTGSTQ
ncbi:hypothetical protein OIE52_34140 [Streptomyces canus]|uniref:hypothetical protein n=1 Tax=Streptomyces canus TaxID=58343 RepID=UPI0032507A5C